MKNKHLRDTKHRDTVRKEKIVQMVGRYLPPTFDLNDEELTLVLECFYDVIAACLMEGSGVKIKGRYFNVGTLAPKIKKGKAYKKEYESAYCKLFLEYSFKKELIGNLLKVENEYKRLFNEESGE